MLVIMYGDIILCFACFLSFTVAGPTPSISFSEYSLIKPV